MEVLTDRGFRFVAGRPVLLQATRTAGWRQSQPACQGGKGQSLTHAHARERARAGQLQLCALLHRIVQETAGICTLEYQGNIM